MRSMICAIGLMLAVASPAAGQTQPAKEAAAPTASVADVAQGKKRDACKATAAKLRGMERADSMQVCMAEARLACIKEAVAQKTPLPKRKEFLASCIGE